MTAFPRLFGLLAVTALAGCTAWGLPPQEGGKDGDPKGEPDSIEIEVGSSSGIYGGGTYNERWVLQRNGECKGTITSGTNDGRHPPITREMEFRSEEVYRECGKLLRETQFFWMRDREPKVRFESSTTWIEARIGLRRHRVCVVSPETSPADFTRVAEFVNGLEKRAKEVKP